MNNDQATAAEATEIAPLDQQEDESDLIQTQGLVRFEAAISSTDWTTETVISQLKKGNITLDPDFQRRDAWTIVRKSQYIESLMMGIPTPQIILAEKREKRGSYIVIDGKQRLLSLRQFSASELDKDYKPFRLKGLNVRKDLNGASYDDFQGDLVRPSAPDFENATIRTVVIRSWPSEDFLYEVFLRINSGSVQLSPQELRQALHPGDFTSALNKFVLGSTTLQNLLGLSQPDFRMRDNEIVLRFIAFRHFLKTYNGNLKQILDDTTNALNFDWKNYKDQFLIDVQVFEESIKVTKEIFGKTAFKKWNGYFYENRINRAIIDVMTYYFADPMVAELSKKHGAEIVKKFEEVCNNWRFSMAISGTTKSVESVMIRFNLWAEALTEVIGAKVSSPLAE